jgi:orotidine-5'-phosphate decarboxylase
MDRLIGAIAEKKNPTVVGLDTRYEYIPPAKPHSGEIDPRRKAEAILDFNQRIVDHVYEYAPAVKVQIAYYELLGLAGMECFIKTVAYAKKQGLLVIVDAKRNDIGTTAEAYAQGYLGAKRPKEKLFFADYLTVNPYLGEDGIRPFIKYCADNEKGIFVLVKTSNPSSGQLQDQVLQSGIKVYRHMGNLVHDWGKELIGASGYSRAGAVVGATYPRELSELRTAMPHTFFLVPGYGTQGGGAADVIGGFDAKGIGAIINASRSVLCAWMSEWWNGEYKPTQYGEAAQAEVLRMRDELTREMWARGICPW